MIESINSVAELFMELFILPLTNSEMYLKGLFVGLALSLILSSIARIFLDARSKILAAFDSYSDMNAQGKIFKYSDK